jgi:exoribonuclease R
MLPVRRLRAPVAATGGHADRSRPREQGREWWDLNEEGTILRGERSGATLRLGDEIEVRVARVEAIRGRVELAPTD